ncbi:MAG: hypothetical protein ABUL60_20460 [Myxococcales bacterium]
MRITFGLIGVLLAVNAVGCSGSTDSHGSGGSGGTTAGAGDAGSSNVGGASGGIANGSGGTSGSAHAGNGASGSAGSSNGSAGAAGSTNTESARWGAVQMIGLLGSGASSTTQISARFGDPEHPQLQAASPCDVSTFGSCTVSTCPTDYVAPDNSTVASPSAGKIAWSDGKTFMGELSPDALGRYAPFNNNTLGFSGGESLTVSGSGGDVPAFSTTVAVPLSLLLASPVADATGHLAWQKTQDLVLTFDRGMPGLDLYVQSMSNDRTSNSFLQCTFPSAPGTATIPAAAMASLSTAHKILLTTAQKQTVAAGDYSVVVWTVLGLLNQTKTYRIQLEIQ